MSCSSHTVKSQVYVPITPGWVNFCSKSSYWCATRTPWWLVCSRSLRRPTRTSPTSATSGTTRTTAVTAKSTTDWSVRPISVSTESRLAGSRELHSGGWTSEGCNRVHFYHPFHLPAVPPSTFVSNVFSKLNNGKEIEK